MVLVHIVKSPTEGTIYFKNNIYYIQGIHKRMVRFQK
jgi:hypothetical protein